MGIGCRFLVVTALLSTSLGVKALAATDEEVRRRLVLSCCFEDDVQLARNAFKNAYRAAESNRVRFARILCDLAQTNVSDIAEGMMAELGDYGTAEQLPFLYSQVSNVQYGATAVRSILRLEGITSNSVAVVDSYLSMTNMTNRNRYYVCTELIDKNSSPTVAGGVREAASRAYLRFMSESNIYHDWLDVKLKSADPSYGFSKRRLSVMRAVRARVDDPADLNFVTNAINELVAYPESDLPE